MARNMENLRTNLQGFKGNRAAAKALKIKIDNQQPELIPLMEKLDPSNSGIIVDEDDTAASTAYVQQNDPSTFWDVEGIIEHVRNDRGLWMSVSSRVFDVAKWEAEIANGNITPGEAKKYKKTGTPPKPFIRFGKMGDESV